jgi:hypothetical protein
MSNVQMQLVRQREEQERYRRVARDADFFDRLPCSKIVVVFAYLFGSEVKKKKRACCAFGAAVSVCQALRLRLMHDRTESVFFYH